MHIYIYITTFQSQHINHKPREKAALHFHSSFSPQLNVINHVLQLSITFIRLLLLSRHDTSPTCLLYGFHSNQTNKCISLS